ncbi:MAG: hypothetical protein MZU97_05855 [Bacillus subtilis]|nr:hypothetical protein [Bacillus subtilis]
MVSRHSPWSFTRRDVLRASPQSAYQARRRGDRRDKMAFSHMPEISGPTIPVPFFPYWGYKTVPLAKNWSYGLASLIFAAIEHQRLEDRKEPQSNR